MSVVLRFSVRADRAGDGSDVELAAAPGTAVGELLDRLDARGRPCYVGSTRLDPTARLAEVPLVPGAVLTVGAPGPVARAVPDDAAGDAVVVLTATAGPDSGLVVPLAPGRHVVARASGAAVPLRDTDVSRGGHARLDVSSAGLITVTDLGSTNGTYVNGVRVTTPVVLAPRAVLQVGSDELAWAPASASARRRIAPDRRVEFDRVFTATPEIPELVLTLPTPRTTDDGTTSTAWIGLLAGAASVAFAIGTGRAWPLVFGLIGLLGYLAIRENEQKRRKKAESTQDRERRAAVAELATHLDAEARARAALAPGPAEIADAATGASPHLWPRRADLPHGLELRLGHADLPASVRLSGTPWPDFPAAVLRAAPVTVDLRATGVLGVVGPHRDGCLRWLLVQLAVLRGPDDLRLVVITADDGHGLAWTRWLPHVDGGDAGVPCLIGNTPDTRAARIAELRGLIAHRRADRVPAGAEVVVVLDGASTLRELPGLADVLRTGPAVGVRVVCVDRHAVNECAAVLDTGDVARLLGVGDPLPLTPDVLDPATADRLARALAPMRDRLARASSREAVPAHARFLDLVGIGMPTADDVLRGWVGRGPRTAVPLGADESGVVSVDLARQGPHTMLGGATGAGKSILLQTLVTSLLLANRPDELNLLLVDFKGGSAFLPFEHCPHVVALVRSTGETAADVFDEAAAARVLTSIRAEVGRRESLLARYDGEIDRYWARRAADPGLPPLPRLVMVFDEFARVLESSPDFLRELVNVAAKGRSLGMHLVLATQSLQGKLSPELKNNVSLRISLRQNEPSDSVEVLDVPDAATLPGSLRGRGLIVCTTAESRLPHTFQTGYLGDPPPDGGTPDAVVRVLGWTEVGTPRPAVARPADNRATDQALVLSAIEEAGRRLDLPAPFRPLWPALPADLGADDLDGPVPATAVPFGLLDDPAAQARPTDFLDLAGTDRLLVAGGPQSGRTTFARAFVAALATRFGPDQAHVYVVERHPSGLTDLGDLPHCGGVFGPGDPERLRRLITWLAAETGRRATAGRRGPHVVVVIDGWELLEDHSDPAYTPTSLVTTLHDVVAKGAPLGVHVVAIGGLDMLNHRLPALYSRRLLLPFPKEETRRAHLTATTASPPAVPGRAVDAATGRHVQFCRPPAVVVPRTAESGAPRRFPPLPTRVDAAVPADRPSPTWIPLGVGGPDAAPLGVDLFGGTRGVLLVSGPEGSGRSTTAASVARSLSAVGVPVLALASPRSPLGGTRDPGVHVLTGAGLPDTELRAAAADLGPRYAVVVDDADQMSVVPTQEGFTDAPTLLDDLANPAVRGDRVLVLTADAAPLATGFPGPRARLVLGALTTGVRLVLCPTDRATALAHNLHLEPDQYLDGPPGRGYLATARTAVPIQVAIA